MLQLWQKAAPLNQRENSAVGQNFDVKNKNKFECRLYVATFSTDMNMNLQANQAAAAAASTAIVKHTVLQAGN